MSDRISALAGRQVEPRPGLALRDLGPRGQITLKADLEIDVVAKSVEKIIGSMPGRLGATFTEDGRGAVWMAPDELLLFVPAAEVAETIAALTEALKDIHHMALDVTDARCVVRLSGPDAAETLAKGTPVDLRAHAFPVGHARRTHLGGLAVGLWRRSETDWEMVCFRSYAHHLFDWLAQTGIEGAEVGHPPLAAG